MAKKRKLPKRRGKLQAVRQNPLFRQRIVPKKKAVEPDKNEDWGNE